MREGSAGPDSSSSRWTRRSVPWLTSRTYSARAPERRCSAIWWRRSKMEKRSSVTTRLISVAQGGRQLLCLGLVGHRLDLVDDVAEGDDLLGDTVVHLAGDPVALLGGRHEAYVVEEDRGVQAEHELVGDRLGACPQVVGPSRRRGPGPTEPRRCVAAVQPHGRATCGSLSASPPTGVRDAGSPYDDSRSGSERRPWMNTADRVAPVAARRAVSQLGGQLHAVEAHSSAAGEGVELGDELVGCGVRRLAVPRGPAWTGTASWRAVRRPCR